MTVVAERIQNQINFGLALDLVRRPRQAPLDGSLVPIRDDLQADECARHLAVHTAQLWGWNDPYLTKNERTRIAKSACNQVAYDLGYKHPLAYTSLPQWFSKLNKMVATGEGAIDPLSPSYAGTKKYMTTIEEQCPGYLHELFRYAQLVKGSLATYPELVEAMNEKSAVPGEERPSITISKWQLVDWFKNNGGVEKSPIEKPLLTKEHKEKRVLWARKWFKKLTDPEIPVAYLDEKWFYTTNRRRVMKKLPKGEDEIKIPEYQKPKIRSQRYPVKVMYMGVVAAPNAPRNFDGRIYLKRVSTKKKQARASRNKRFSPELQVNEELSNGGWRRLLPDDGDITGREALDTLIDVYELDEFIAERLEFYFITHTGRDLKPQNKKITDTQRLNELGIRKDEEGEQQNIELDDVQVCVHLQKNDEVEEDCSCDSTFMKKWIPDVGRAMREAYHWIGVNEKLYLVMDNAGGHGTDDAKTIYTNALREFNIEIIWQIPRSPETNMLDLGVWMSIQAAVMRVHHMRRCHHDALAKSVEDAWNGNLSTQAFYNVFKRLRVVLQSIIKDEGGNRLVEQHRGKLFRDANIIDLTSIDDENLNEIEVDTEVNDADDASVVDLIHEEDSDIEID